MCGLALASLTLLAFLAAPFGQSEAISVRIERGMDSREIGELLESRGLVRSSTLFAVATMLEGVQGELRAGEYRLSPRMGLFGIVRAIAEGKVEYVEFTVPEGFTLEEIAGLLESRGLADGARFLALAKGQVDGFSVTGTGFELPRNLEGYLFPDTYKIQSGISEEAIIRAMVERFSDVAVPELSRDDIDGMARELGLHAIVTMASIIEEEARLPEERPLVAAVFYNRLRRGMPLQSCATVQYALGKRKERLSYDDLAVDSPYNTYLAPGLPPGPIASPGLASIRAALHPAPVDYLYFAADERGGHVFSRTFSQHQRAIALLKAKE